MSAMRVGMEVTVTRGYDCDRCGEFTPYNRLTSLGNLGVCFSCGLHLGRHIRTTMNRNASEIGKIASALTPDSEGFNDVRDAIVEIANEIYNQTVLVEKAKDTGRRAK